VYPLSFPGSGLYFAGQLLFKLLLPLTSCLQLKEVSKKKFGMLAFQALQQTIKSDDLIPLRCHKIDHKSHCAAAIRINSPFAYLLSLYCARLKLQFLNRGKNSSS